jgi:hypothetical protein
MARKDFRSLSRHRGRLLRQQRYTLQRTQKTEEGTQHPDRDAQFRYINDTARARLDQGLPVVSVDTKKRSCKPPATNPRLGTPERRGGGWVTGRR